MVEEVVNGIYRIEVPLPQTPLKALNVYLIKGETRHLLVDNGFNRPECRDALLGGLSQLGVSLDHLDLCITHLHADHCGLTADLVRPGTAVYSSAGDGAVINQMAVGQLPDGSPFWSDLLQEMAAHGVAAELLRSLESNHPAIRFGPSGPVCFTPLREGNALQYGSFLLQVLSVPGHTPDHLALYEPQRKILLSGDVILGDISPNISHWRGMEDALGLYLRSLDKLYALDIALTLPGHRSLVHNTRERIETLRQHHAHRLDEVRGILHEKSLNAFEVAAAMTWAMRGTAWDAFQTPQKWFATNEALAHLEYLVGLGEAVRQHDSGGIRFCIANTRA